MKWYKYDIRDLCDAEYNKWYSLMSEDKRHRVGIFLFADDKRRTVPRESLRVMQLPNGVQLSRKASSLLKAYLHRKKEYERKIQSLTNSLEKGYSDALLNRLMQNEATLKEIEEQLKDTKTLLIEDKEELNSIRAYLKEVLMTSSDPEIKLFLKKCIKSISVSNEQIKVELQI